MRRLVYISEYVQFKTTFKIFFGSDHELAALRYFVTLSDALGRIGFRLRTGCLAWYNASAVH